MGMMDLRQAAMWSGAELVGVIAQEPACEISCVSTDTRSIPAGALFVALVGERFDAHDFIISAVAEGATAAMVNRERASVLALDPRLASFPLLVVDDTRKGLGRLAAEWRRQFQIPVIGITGSNGKTTTKEMIASILGVAFPLVDQATTSEEADSRVLATQGNLNNEIGLPLTLLRLRSFHAAAVVEMGMSHPGEIGYLSQIAMPTVGVVTNAQRAHLEGMNDLEAVAREKGCIYSGLAADGVAIIPGDETFTPLWVDMAADYQTIKVGSPGKSMDLTYFSGTEERGAPEGTFETQKLVLEWQGKPYEVLVPLLGAHNLKNAAVAAAATLSAGVSMSSVITGLEKCRGAKGRLERKPGPQGAVVVDDSYNANPDSVRAAIDVLASHSGPKILVLGDMGEIGDSSEACHTEVGEYAREKGISTLFSLGQASQRAASSFGGQGYACNTPEELVSQLLPRLDSQTMVLVKGSRFMRMERVVNLLSKLSEIPVPVDLGTHCGEPA